MPLSVTRLFGHHRFRHHARRRLLCPALLGMLSIAATLCLLLTPSLPALDSLLATAPRQAAMTPSQKPHHNSPASPHPNNAVPVAQPRPPTNQQQEPSSMEYATRAAHRPLARLPAPLIAHLPASHALPPPPSPSGAGFGNKEKRKPRLIFVGDIHGHLHVLRALLDKIHFDHRHGDHLVLVGDIVAKGPDSAGVVDFAMHVGASGVRGNHENKVLLAHKALQRGQRRKKTTKHHLAAAGIGEFTQDVLSPTSSSSSSSSSDGGGDFYLLTENDDDGNNDNDDEVVIDTHTDHARAVARSLSPKQLKWLASLPVMLRVGAVPGAAEGTSAPWDAGEILVVHAGLVPALALEKQDPWAVMNMRTLLYPAPREEGDGSGEADVPAIPTETRAGEPWSHAWNRFQNVEVSAPGDRTVVIYGHDARAGLQADVDVRIRPHPAARRRPKTRRDEELGMGVYVASDEADTDGDEKEVEAKATDDEEVVNGTGNVALDDGDDDGDNQRRSDGAETERKKKAKKGKKKMMTRGIRYAFGLDSGCGHGRQLSALVLEAAREDGTVVHRIEQVDCGEVEKDATTKL